MHNCPQGPRVLVTGHSLACVLGLRSNVYWGLIPMRLGTSVGVLNAVLQIDLGTFCECREACGTPHTHHHPPSSHTHTHPNTPIHTHPFTSSHHHPPPTHMLSSSILSHTTNHHPPFCHTAPHTHSCLSSWWSVNPWLSMVQAWLEERSRAGGCPGQRHTEGT